MAKHSFAPFVGVDGEGGNIGERHTYTMLRIGKDYLTAYPKCPPEHWLHFIGTRPKGYIYVSYYFDYDVSMICRDLPIDRIIRLLKGEWTQVDEYRIRYHPRKFFAVRYQGREVVINDVGTFFQCRFLDALKQWNVGTTEQHAIIEAGKNDRGKFTVLTQETIDYNGMECELLVQLMERFRTTLAQIGYLPKFWRGPGQLAKAMLAKHNVPMTEQLPDPNLAGVWHAAQSAYFGGRFETSAVGPIRIPIDGWDINSAYPWACTNLPCLQHGSWRPTRDIVPLGLYRIEYTNRPGPWNALPHRRPDGSVHYPRVGSGTYWGIEILAGHTMGLSTMVRTGVAYIQECTHFPLDFLNILYTERKRIGKSQAGYAIKLAMNSAYGVTAQSVGRAEYANPIYAGLITAMTRAKILNAISRTPEDVYMIATDGLFARAGSLNLEESETLGGWERKPYPDGIHIVQPGLYFADEAKPKTRGVPLDVVKTHKEELIDAWTGTADSHYQLPVRQFIGLRLAAARGKIETAGTWVDTYKDISYSWATKRRPDIYDAKTIFRTYPYNAATEESVPYDRIIGGMANDRHRLEWEDTPEWAQPEL